MSKQVHFTLPFVALDGTNYRIDIYGDGAPVGGVKQLTGGAEPFTTDEDNSDDFYTPVRKHTGVIHIINDSLLSLYDILPTNNTDRFVRLINEGTNAVEWQGFLSCESYSQDYTARPHSIDVNVNSILATLNSVKVTVATASSLTMVRKVITDALSRVIAESGVDYTIFNRVYYPYESWKILDHKIDMTAFLSLHEIDDEETVSYSAEGISCYDLLSRLCRFMGWTLREAGDSFYFTQQQTSLGYSERMKYETFANFANTRRYTKNAPVTEIDMEDLSWRGIDHRATTMQGAKSVEVVAQMADNKINIDVPTMPVGNTKISYVNTGYYQLQLEKDRWEYVWLCASMDYRNYSNIRLNYYQVESWMTNIGVILASNPVASTIEDVRDNFACIKVRNSQAYKVLGTIQSGEHIPYYVGGVMSRAEFEEYKSNSEPETKKKHDWTNGLYCSMIPMGFNNDLDIPIVTFDNILPFVAVHGYFLLNITSKCLYYSGGYFTFNPDVFPDNELTFRLKFGDKYWNGTAWTSTKSNFSVLMNGEGTAESNWEETFDITDQNCHLIPVPSYMSGFLTLELFPFCDDALALQPFEVFFSTIKLDYVEIKDDSLVDRDANHYYRLLDTNFSDEVTVDVELASNLHNNHTASIFMFDTEHELKQLAYQTSAGQVNKRPEKHLLDRLASYYSAPRTMVELETEHPAGESLPLVMFAGFDGKKYAPLAESREWKSGKCKITCFEVPQ